MAWIRFKDLTPVQSIVGQELLLVHPAYADAQLRRKFHRWEFLVTDGRVRGARLFQSPRHKDFLDSLLSQGRYDVRSTTDLKDWKSTPTPFSVSHD